MAKRQGLDSKIERPLDALFTKQEGEKAEEKQPKPVYDRVTYYLTKEQKECIRIMSFRMNKEKSEIVRELLVQGIPEEIMAEAVENVKTL